MALRPLIVFSTALRPLIVFSTALHILYDFPRAALFARLMNLFQLVSFAKFDGEDKMGH
jgi:hypothetical protein